MSNDEVPKYRKLAVVAMVGTEVKETGKMNLTVVSEDRRLFQLCREVLAEQVDRDWSLVAGSSGTLQSESDFCVWDLTPGSEIPNVSGSERQRYLFLVPRETVPDFRKKFSDWEVSILLKPINPANFKTFLSHVCASRLSSRAGHRDEVDLLRADRDEIFQCLLLTNLKLQEYDIDRTNFLAKAVHDFRAPLTALMGYCGLILGEQLGPITDDQRDVLDRMLHSAERLSIMTNAMFHLSVGRHVETTPNLQKDDIRKCIDQALFELMPASQEKNITMSLEVAESPQSLYFEGSQLEQVMINLLDNAMKFTPKFGSIEIRAYPFFWERRLGSTIDPVRPTDRRLRGDQTPNSFRVDIRDSGPGVSAVHLDRIFEEYTSYSGGQDRSGGGLGLAICKMIVNRHQGDIWAEGSENGTTFSFVLPFRLAQPSTAREVDSFEIKYA